MAATDRPRWRVPLYQDLLVSLLASALFCLVLALGLLRLAGELRQQELARPANRLIAALIVAGVAGPGGLAAGLMVHLSFRGQRSRQEGRLMWRAQRGTVPLLGAAVGAVAPLLLLWALLPLYWRLVPPGQGNPLDAFVEAVFPLALTGAVAGGIGAFCATLLHRPRSSASPSPRP